MDHPKTVAFDKKLREVFTVVDNFLEDQFGSHFKLHPNRPERGETSNPQMDGLFNVGASFSAGFGSHFGRGYVVDVHISTLERIPKNKRQEITDIAIKKLKDELKRVFPDRELHVDLDGRVYKVHGDFSLGNLN